MMIKRIYLLVLMVVLILVLPACDTGNIPTDSPTIAPTAGTTPRNNWRESIPDVLENIVIGQYDEQEITDVSFDFEYTNFSRMSETYQNDVFVNIIVKTGWWKTDGVFTCAFINETQDILDFSTQMGEYFLAFHDVEYRTTNQDAQLISLVQKPKNQVITKRDVTGTGATIMFMWIHNYNAATRQFDIIFNESLVETTPLSENYYLVNDYAIEENGDISLTVNRFYNKGNIETSNADDTNTILYRFNGKEYKPIKGFFDYRQPLRELYQDDTFLLEREKTQHL